MKKDKQTLNDELRPEYKRSDFGTMVRGKYVRRLSKETNIVVIDPELTKAFPNEEAVNKALRGLLEIAQANVKKSAGRRRNIE